jgi:hypothetical protein
MRSLLCLSLSLSILRVSGVSCPSVEILDGYYVSKLCTTEGNQVVEDSVISECVSYQDGVNFVSTPCVKGKLGKGEASLGSPGEVSACSVFTPPVSDPDNYVYTYVKSLCSTSSPYSRGTDYTYRYSQFSVLS